jgi:hypothetical protein
MNVDFAKCRIKSYSLEDMDKAGVCSPSNFMRQFFSNSRKDNVGVAKYGRDAWDEYEFLSPILQLPIVEPTNKAS